MSRGKRRNTPAHVCPRGRINANPQKALPPSKRAKRVRSDSRASRGRRPLSPRERRLISVLRVELTHKGISHSKAGTLAGVDPGDARRVLAFGETTPRTLRKLFETFKVNGYETLSLADRRGALLLEIHAAAERQAELLGELAALAAASDPPGL